MILSAALLLVGASLFTTSCKNGEDGVDGTSAEALILRETGNVWYKYTDSSDTDEKPSATKDGDNVSFSDFYIKYNTSSGKLIVVATGNSTSTVSKLFYASKEAELSKGKWAASVVTLRLMGKITKSNSDPTSGRIDITNITDLGNFSADKLITKLFE